MDVPNEIQGLTVYDFFSVPDVNRMDVYLAAVSAVNNGFKPNIIGPNRRDYFDTIGSMDRLWAFKDFGIEFG